MKIFLQVQPNEFETALVKEPSVFEPLTFYCGLVLQYNNASESCRIACLFYRSQFFDFFYDRNSFAYKRALYEPDYVISSASFRRRKRNPQLNSLIMKIPCTSSRD